MGSRNLSVWILSIVSLIVFSFAKDSLANQDNIILNVDAIKISKPPIDPNDIIDQLCKAATPQDMVRILRVNDVALSQENFRIIHDLMGRYCGEKLRDFEKAVNYKPTVEPLEPVPIHPQNWRIMSDPFPINVFVVPDSVNSNEETKEAPDGVPLPNGNVPPVSLEGRRPNKSLLPTVPPSALPFGNSWADGNYFDYAEFVKGAKSMAPLLLFFVTPGFEALELPQQLRQIATACGSALTLVSPEVLMADDSKPKNIELKTNFSGEEYAIKCRWANGRYICADLQTINE